MKKGLLSTISLSISKLLIFLTCLFSIQCVGNGNNANNNATDTVLKEKVENLEYVDLGLSVYWASCNIGAEKPEEYGDYFAWGETDTHYELGFSDSISPKWKIKHRTGYDFKSYSLIKNYSSEYGNHDFTRYSPNPRNFVQGVSYYSYSELKDYDDVAYCKRGSGWHMPSRKEFRELIENCDVEFILYNGSKGFKFTSRVLGYKGNSIFLPAAGYMSGTSITGYKESCHYWSSSYEQYEHTDNATSFMGSISLSEFPRSRAYGLTVRPVLAKSKQISMVCG